MHSERAIAICYKSFQRNDCINDNLLEESHFIVLKACKAHFDYEKTVEAESSCDVVNFCFL